MMVIAQNVAQGRLALHAAGYDPVKGHVIVTMPEQIEGVELTGHAAYVIAKMNDKRVIECVCAAIQCGASVHYELPPAPAAYPEPYVPKDGLIGWLRDVLSRPVHLGGKRRRVE